MVCAAIIVDPCQDQVDEAVKTLLDLKNKYKSLTGAEYKPVAAAGGGEHKNHKERENKAEKKQGGGGSEGKKGKGDKSHQAKEPSGGAGGAGDGQGPKKQTRWDRNSMKGEGQSRPTVMFVIVTFAFYKSFSSNHQSVSFEAKFYFTFCI